MEMIGDLSSGMNHHSLNEKRERNGTARHIRRNHQSEVKK